jgi:2,3-bisphosphoglycerate-independent phosphoglycerate mutase
MPKKRGKRKSKKERKKRIKKTKRVKILATKKPTKRKKVIMIVVDGMADLPINGKTPLSEAYKPNMDYMATNGVTGQLELVDKKTKPSSHNCNIALMGYDTNRYYIKRGPLEAIGANIPYKEGHVAMRCNFATVDNELKVIDRRVGRNFQGLDELARYVNENVKTEVDHIFMRTYGHRAVLILKENLDPRITDSDPHQNFEFVKPVEPLAPEAANTAKIVQEFVNKARGVIEFHPANEQRIHNGIAPANYILTRDAGNQLPELGSFVKKHAIKKAVCISENGVMKATCMIMGFNAVTVPELKFEPSLKFIFDSIDNLLPEYDFIYAHIKGPDEPAHDGDFHNKRKMIEEIDAKLGKYRDFDGIVILTCDHITACKLRAHAPGPVPVLVYGKGSDKVKKFDESQVVNGKLGTMSGKKLWDFVFGK